MSDYHEGTYNVVVSVDVAKDINLVLLDVDRGEHDWLVEECNSLDCFISKSVVENKTPGLYRGILSYSGGTDYWGEYDSNLGLTLYDRILHVDENSIAENEVVIVFNANGCASPLAFRNQRFYEMYYKYMYDDGDMWEARELPSVWIGKVLTDEWPGPKRSGYPTGYRLSSKLLYDCTKIIMHRYKDEVPTTV